jgi:signal transduction histidine kinase
MFRRARDRRFRAQRVVILATAGLVVAFALGAGLLCRSASRWSQAADALAFASALFALTAGTLAGLVVRAFGRHQLAMAQLRRSEARLRRQSTLLQSTLDNIGEGISVFNQRGRLLAWNARFGQLLELPAGTIAGSTLRAILTRQAMRGDFGARSPEAEVARRVRDFYREVPTVREREMPNGSLLQIRRGPMPDGGVVSVYSDISAIRASERKLIEARSQAELANRAKSDFLANMSHELRTPLNAIIGFSEIISNELFGPIKNARYVEYMKDIHASSLHLLSIINDVLDMSKIEAGKLELNKEAVVLQSVVADALRMMQERAHSRGLELVAELAPQNVVIWADERSIKQIFLNLLSNAMKFSPQGSRVVVRVAVEPDDRAILEVEDHGIGMNEEEQERALQPFGQAKPATTRNYGGTGLGLPISKGLVEAHGGVLSLHSVLGRGTIVRIALPGVPAMPDRAAALRALFAAPGP